MSTRRHSAGAAASTAPTAAGSEVDDASRLLAAHRAMYCAMLQRDTSLLDKLLDEHYTLTHMTGYVQSKSEWLRQIESGEMAYHSEHERSASIELRDKLALLTSRNVVDATIWGSRSTWNLQLDITYEKRSERWVALRAVASTF